ncbi:MAG: helix-turn-helix domain-containing protein [Bacilli bacterium]|nr:helix-turn-helix domain-containing protein [Bacilli bacterium]MDD4795215.1 helix-turn-helix domain-containing protein [Bacilli bacterium]
MTEISEVLKGTRESSGVSLDEVSKDLEIPLLVLEQIEEGNTGAFKDIFALKEHISDYAKYLGLDPTEVIDEFNEYMFEITSKIPMKEIEKAAREKAEAEENEERVASPYTKSAPKSSDKQFVLMLLLIIVLVILAVIWSVKQITVGNVTTNIMSYFN